MTDPKAEITRLKAEIERRDWRIKQLIEERDAESRLLAEQREHVEKAIEAVESTNNMIDRWISPLRWCKTTKATGRLIPGWKQADDGESFTLRWCASETDALVS